LNQFFGSLALLPIEKLLNALIDRDPHVARQCSRFDGKCIEVICDRPALSLSVRFEDDLIKLSAIDSETLGISPDASIRGSVENLLGLLLQKPEGRALADTSIDVSGDATLFQDLLVTLANLDIDWQDILAPLLGDVLSNELGELQRGASEWGKAAGHGMQRNLSDYLSEEARLVPGALEVESFSNRLDRLRLSVDRATAKTQLLERRLALIGEPK